MPTHIYIYTNMYINVHIHVHVQVYISTIVLTILVFVGILHLLLITFYTSMLMFIRCLGILGCGISGVSMFWRTPGFGTQDPQGLRLKT